MLLDKIKNLGTQYFEEAVEIRHYLHQHPEHSFQEHKTTEFILNYIKKIDNNIEIFTQFSKTGLVAKISGKNPSKHSVAIRADIDALPIIEETGTPYQSLNNGIMHACGHDLHTTSLLLACKILSTLKNEIDGSFWCIFQPAEEKLPGGAKQMIDNGLLDFIKPDKIIGQHVMPNIEAGKVGIHSGNYMASTDELYITVEGRGGHAALPHEINDTVLISSHIIVALQQIVSRFIPAHIPSVLSFGKIIANGATNIIPNKVNIEGTFRTMDEIWRAKAKEKIKTIAQGMAQSMGAKATINIVDGYPVLYNNPDLASHFKTIAQHFLGNDNVLDIDLRMTAEDFAYYSHKVPSVFYRIGTGNASKGITYPLHSSKFDIDESVLEYSSALLAYTALNV